MHTFTKRFSFALVMISLFSMSLTAQSTTQELASSSLQRQVTGTVTNPGSALQQVDELPLSTFSDSADWTISATTTTDTLLWEFSTVPLLTGTFTGQTIASETVADGFALLNFDRSTGGDTSTPPVTNELTSPSYDITALDAGGQYQLSFYSQTRHCCGGALGHGIQFSLDGGATFSPVQLVDGTLGANVLFEGITSIALPAGVEAATEFQVRFVYTGGFYFWAIDDIAITSLPPIEIQTNDFFAIAPNFATPTVFTAGTPMSFVADVQNNGGETLDMQLAITLADSTGMVVYTDTLLYTDIITDSLAQNVAFPMTTPTPTAVGAYTGTYELFTARIDEDAVPTNNIQTFDFEVTENVFSKGNTGLRTIDCCADDFDFSSANIYYTPDVAAGDTVYINDVTFAISYEEFTDDEEAFLEVKVYGYRGDLNLDTAPQYGDLSDPDAELVELSLLDFFIDTTSSAIQSDVIITTAPSEDGSVWYLPSDFIGFAVQVDYFASVAGGTNVDNDFAIYGANLDYGGVSLAADSTENSRNHSLLVVPGRNIDTYGYFNGVVPLADASISIGAPIVSSAKETVLNTAQFTVRPNPATTQFTIDFDFATTVDAQFEIINAVGQTVSAFNRDGLSTGAITIPTQGMNNGLYYVKVRTNDGQTASRKLLLAR